MCSAVAVVRRSALVGVQDACGDMIEPPAVFCCAVEVVHPCKSAPSHMLAWSPTHHANLLCSAAGQVTPNMPPAVVVQACCCCCVQTPSCGVAGPHVSCDRILAMLLDLHGSCGCGPGVVGVGKLGISQSSWLSRSRATTIRGCTTLMHLQAAAQALSVWLHSRSTWQVCDACQTHMAWNFAAVGAPAQVCSTCTELCQAGGLSTLQGALDTALQLWLTRRGWESLLHTRGDTLLGRGLVPGGKVCDQAWFAVSSSRVAGLRGPHNPLLRISRTATGTGQHALQRGLVGFCIVAAMV